MSRKTNSFDLSEESSVSDIKIKDYSSLISEESDQDGRIPMQSSRRGRRRTGRTEQINIKARPDVIEQLYRISERERMVLGEVLEHALNAFDRMRGRD